MKKVIPLAIILPLLLDLPYLLGWLLAGPHYVFNGLLFDTFDGYSYLAKLYQGWEGHWRFVLPYTASQGQGAYIYLVHIFMGHVARWLNISVVLAYHLGRTINGMLMILALGHFFQRYLKNDQQAWKATLLALFGTGLGWIALIFGSYTSDMWVAEAFPFLSAITNLHFPLAIAIILWLLSEMDSPVNGLTGVLTVLAGVLLAMISPFGVLVLGLVWLVKVVWDGFETRQIRWLKLVLYGLGSGPMVAYMVWAIYTDPVLAGWNRQNQTPTLGIPDFIISFSPMLLLALVGVYAALNHKLTSARPILIWLILGCLLINIPFSLQRRLIVGLFIPVAGMAVIGLDAIRGLKPKIYRWINLGLIPITLPTLLIILALPVSGILTHNSMLYTTQDESRALQWIANHTPPNSLVLASPTMGLMVPAFTGRRVIYGHPFETVNAKVEEQAVLTYYSGEQSASQEDQFIAQRGINYIFYGPREAALGRPSDLSELPVVYQSGDVTVYATHP